MLLSHDLCFVPFDIVAAFVELRRVAEVLRFVHLTTQALEHVLLHGC